MQLSKEPIHTIVHKVKKNLFQYILALNVHLLIMLWYIMLSDPVNVTLR
jgi:hypothetical protein